MIEGEPAFACVGRQRGKAFIQGGPVAERFQADGFAFGDGLVQIKQSAITDVMHDIHVHAGHLVAVHEETELGQRETVFVQTEQPDTQPRFHQDFHAVARQGNFCDHFVQRQAGGSTFLHQFQNAGVAQGAARLKHHGGEGDTLGLGFGVKGGLGVFFKIVHYVSRTFFPAQFSRAMAARDRSRCNPRQTSPALTCSPSA